MCVFSLFSCDPACPRAPFSLHYNENVKKKLNTGKKQQVRVGAAMGGGGAMGGGDGRLLLLLLLCAAAAAPAGVLVLKYDTLGANLLKW